MDTDKVFKGDRNDIFMNNLNSTLSVKKDSEIHEYDYAWIDIVEDVLPYLDNILRNPKRFIINEEDIVKVELAKKVTVESVIHLTQHTNLIQDFDEKTGDVQPAKILNINKEESLDTYENRFIYTLITNLRVFIEQRMAIMGDNSFFQESKKLRYEGNSVVSGEKIDFKLELSSNLYDVKDNNNKDSVRDRLKRIKLQLDGFMGSELMQTLAKLHVSLVRSPIRKTNVILKNPNFRKAEELWNYIQSYVNNDINEVKTDNYFDDGIVKEQYDQAILMTYIATCKLSEDRSEFSGEEMFAQVMDRMIDNLLDADPTISEDELKQLFCEQIKKVKEENNKKKKEILRIFKMKLDNDINNINRSFELLDKGV